MFVYIFNDAALKALEYSEKQYVLVEFIFQLSRLVYLEVWLFLLFMTFLVASWSIHFGNVSRESSFVATTDRVISWVTCATSNYFRAGGGDIVAF